MSKVKSGPPHPIDVALVATSNNDDSGVWSDDHIGLQVLPSMEADCFTDGNVLNDSQSDQNSGWFEVKKKNRFSGKSKIQKHTSTSKKPAGPYRKAYSGQDGREESNVNLSCVEQKESSANHLNEQFSIECKDLSNYQCAKDAVDSQSVLADNVERLTVSSAADKMMQLAKDTTVLTATPQVTGLSDTPKFKWGNLDDEDLTQSITLDVSTERSAQSSQVTHHDGVTKIEDSTICLEGGKQSSTKELNGLRKEDSGKARADYSHKQDVCDKPESSSIPHTPTFGSKSETGDDGNDAFGEGCMEDMKILTVEDLSSIAAGSIEEDPSSDGKEKCRQLSSNKPSFSECGMVFADSSSSASENAHESINCILSEPTNELASLDSTVVELGDKQQAVQDVSGFQSSGGGRSSNKQSMEFSVAASMLMGKFEETKSGESKERFRQRLWCYLFENLNRAIDELYFLCELECDMEQIQEALLVLKEAGMDFSELKSRVEGFEKIKKHPCAPQLLFGGNTGGSFPAKVEHRRPHAIAWEVRRMACSPHRAEILSSSLEAFKKVQQITAQRSLVTQSKRREASKLLDIERSHTDVPAKQISSENPSNEAILKTEGRQKSPAKIIKPIVPTAQNGDKTQGQILGGSEHLPEEDCIAAGSTSAKTPSSEKAQNAAIMDLASCNAEATDSLLLEESTSMALTLENDPANAGKTNKSTEKRVSIVDNHQREKKTPKTRSSMDAWKVKRNWEDVLSSPLKSLNRPSRSPCPGWKSTERVKVLHDKLMSPERKRKSPLEMKKEVDEKQARATRIRRELENERVQRLQKQTEKLNRVSEWQAVRSSKLREGMHARQQRGESRHEAHLAEIARRAGDESSKVSEVRFITSLNEENKKLSLRQRLQDSELRRAERLQIIKIKQKEDVAREEAVLERRRIIEAERLQRLAEAQRKKEEAKARREEERKAASAAREARAVEQVRKKEVRAKAQQEVTELQAQKLIEKLRESELRRKCYLEQIRERAAMESREQASPSARLSSSKDGPLKMSGSQTVTESDGSIEKETAITKQGSGNKGTSGLPSGLPTLKAPKMALQHQNLKKRVKKIRQRLTAKKYEFVEPPAGVEGFGIGSITVGAAARSKIGRWLQDLQRFQLARKAGASGVSFIVAEMIKYFDGKAAELHAARQAGLVDFIATALPASHTSKAEASQTTLSLLRILKVLLALPANRSYFISRNLLPPLIPILSTALENFSSQDSVSVTVSNSSLVSLNGTTVEKSDAVGEVLNGLLQCVIMIINHTSSDERQISIQDDLVELLTACEVIHHLRDLFSLFDRPQIEGAPFPAPVLFGLHLLQALTVSRHKPVKLSYDAEFSAMLVRREAEKFSFAFEDKRPDPAVSAASLLETTEPLITTREENRNILTDSEHQAKANEHSHSADNREVEPCAASVLKSSDNFEVVQAVENLLDDNSRSESVMTQNDETKREAIENGDGRQKEKQLLEETLAPNQESCNVNCAVDKIAEQSIEKGQTRQSVLPVCPSISFLVSAIAETGLVGLPSLLTAVLLQTNPRSTPEQAATVLPSNFEEVATCVLKVLNNLARLDLGLVQSLLAMPDLQMEFFHLVSFLLSHSTCKWTNSTDQVASLLLETLLLLGYFALLHPGNQTVLRWGKSPTILHKICDLPFAFFSDPLLMPALVGTLLAVCYGSEQNRDVVREELSMEMLLSLLKSSRTESKAEKDTFAETTQTGSNEHNYMTSHFVPVDVTSKEEKADSPAVQDEECIPAKEEIKRMIEDVTGSDSETNPNAQQQVELRASCGKSLNPDTVFSPIKKLNKTASKATVTGEGETILLNKESSTGRGTISRTFTRGNVLSTNTENASAQTRKMRGCGLDSSARNGIPGGGSVSNKRQPSAAPLESQQASVSISADSCEPSNACPRHDLMLLNRFPARLLDMAQEFFAAGL